MGLIGRVRRKLEAISRIITGRGTGSAAPAALEDDASFVNHGHGARDFLGGLARRLACGDIRPLATIASAQDRP